MKVFVVNKTTFESLMVVNKITKENVYNDTKNFFILIFDSVPRNNKDVPFFDSGSNVKILNFDDVENDSKIPLLGTDNAYDAKAFTIDQAIDLLEFLDKNKDKETCIVHCSAGISRSGAIGTFVNDYFKGDYFDFKRQNSHIKPNNLVLRMMKAAMVNKYHDEE